MTVLSFSWQLICIGPTLFIWTWGMWVVSLTHMLLFFQIAMAWMCFTEGLLWRIKHAKKMMIAWKVQWTWVGVAHASWAWHSPFPACSYPLQAYQLYCQPQPTNMASLFTSISHPSYPCVTARLERALLTSYHVEETSRH